MKLDNEVLSVIGAAITEGPYLRLVGQLDRKLYERTNKALEAAGGQWNRKAKAHIFPMEAEAAIEGMLLTGSIVIPKEEFEFFETPPEVLEILMLHAHVSPGMQCLEPSAGSGVIARRLHEAGGIVDCCEIQKAQAERLAGADWIRSCICADFLSLEPTQRYDRVVMNPPFSRQADIKHVMHALRMLRSDGVLASVMAAGVVFRSDRRATAFRELVEGRGGIIEPLPEKSFRVSGTDVNTVVAVVPGA